MNVVGHRGASVAEAENTPAAFVAADRMGADGVELDVRLASDGRGGARLVVFHDPLPDEQVELDAIPGLEEVFESCGDRMLINVEIKNSANEGGFDPTMAVVAPTIAAIRRFDEHNVDRWLISSFSIETVGHCRLLAPELATAVLTEGLGDDVIAAAAAGGHSAIHPWAPMLDEDRVAACRRAGLRINTWTCNDPERIVALDALGVDGVCTDVPDIALAALGRSDETGSSSPAW